MKVENILIAWTAKDSDYNRNGEGCTAGQCLVMRHPDVHYVSMRYECFVHTPGGPWGDIPEVERTARLVGQAFHLVCEGIPVEDVLREFAKIPEWRHMSAPLLMGWWERAIQNGKWSPYNP